MPSCQKNPYLYTSVYLKAAITTLILYHSTMKNNLKTNSLISLFIPICSLCLSVSSCNSQKHVQSSDNSQTESISPRDRQDKKENIRLLVSAETSTYHLWYTDQPIECLLVKENNEETFKKIGLKEIEGFTYEKGHEYLLEIEKTTLANPPADASNIRYKLLKVVKESIPSKM